MKYASLFAFLIPIGIIAVIFSTISNSIFSFTPEEEAVLKKAQKSLQGANSQNTSPSPEVISGYKPYRETYGVKIMYPKDWTYRETTNDESSPDTIFNVNFFSPVDAKNGILLLGISIEKLKPPESLEVYKNRILGNMKKIPDTKEIAVTKDTLSGRLAYRIEDTGFLIDRWEKRISIYSVVKGILYEVDVFAEPELVQKYSKDIKNIIQSVQFEKPTQSSADAQVVSIQKKPTFSNEKCGVSIQYPKGWKAEPSEFVFEDKSKTLASFQPPDDDILQLDLAIENMGLANRSPVDISRLERDIETLGDTTVLETDIAQINGFPSYKIVYTQGSIEKSELQKDKFHNMEILIIAYDREYRLTYGEPNKEAFDKYRSIVEDMANSVKINEPKFEGINCQ